MDAPGDHMKVCHLVLYCACNTVHTLEQDISMHTHKQRDTVEPIMIMAITLWGTTLTWLFPNHTQYIVHNTVEMTDQQQMHSYCYPFYQQDMYSISSNWINDPWKKEKRRKKKNRHKEAGGGNGDRKMGNTQQSGK